MLYISKLNMMERRVMGNYRARCGSGEKMEIISNSYLSTYTMGIYPLFTKQAIEDAKEKMHPRFSKSMWVNPANMNQTPYSPKLDAVATIYLATKS